MSDRRNESTRHHKFENKENVYVGIQSRKLCQHKIENKRKGLSSNVENCVADSTVPNSSAAKSRFPIYCDDDVERESRSRVRKNMDRKENKTKHDIDEEIKVHNITIFVPARRANSATNIHDATLINKNNYVRTKRRHRSTSESNKQKSIAPCLTPFPSTGCLSKEVKRRTLWSIQSWKEKMKKHTGAIPKNFNAMHTNKQKNTSRDKSKSPNINIAIRKNQDFNVSAVQKVTKIITSSRIEVGSNNQTPPRYSPELLLMTPAKVRYEKRNHASTVKKSELDDISQMSCDYLEEIPDTERRKEEHTPKLSSRFLRENINEKQRRIIVEYFFRLGYHCHYSSNIIYQSIKLFDVAVDRILVETSDIQLMALACLWLTLKREANADTIPTATLILQLAKDQYTGREKCLLMYEKKILSAAKFNIQFADPFSLLLYYISNANKEFRINSRNIKHIYFSGSYLIEVSLLEESLCDTSVFVLAIAATELSLYLTYPYHFSIDGTSRKFWRHRRSLEEWEERRIGSTKHIMLNLVLDSETDELVSRTIYKKYLSTKYGGISGFLLDRVKKVNL